MKINSADISDYHAKQWRVTFDQSDISNESEWPRGSPLPFFSVNHRMFKTIEISMLVYGDNREQIRNRISDITALLLDAATLELDGYVRKFRGILKKSSVKEGSDQARKRFQTLELEFEGYEYGEVVSTTAAGVTQLSVYNPGNVESPAVITISPQIGMDELTITGIGRDSSGTDLPATVYDLTTGKNVILDGINGLITEDGILKEVNIWTLPAMKPGNNEITLSSNRINIEVRVLPVYM